MSSGKRKVFVLFDTEDLIEFRKILFSKGLSVQEFFSYIIHRSIMRDKDVDPFYEGSLAIKEEIMKGGGEEGDLKNVKITDVDSMYDFIEKRLKGKQNETPEK